MSNLRDFDDYAAERTPHNVAELIRVKCYNRWIGSWLDNVPLKDLPCPNCKTCGTIITTGQYLPEDN